MIRTTSAYVGLGILCGLFTWCCGSNGARPDDGAVQVAPSAPVASCGASWQPVAEPRDALEISEAAFGHDELVYGGVDETTQQFILEAQPLDGGAPRRLADGVLIRQLWTEADRVLYATPEGLWQIPASGGTPELLIQIDRPSTAESLAYYALSPSSLYWLLLDIHKSAPSEIWAQSREAGSVPRLLATFPASLYPAVFALAGNELIVSDRNNHVFVSLDNGSSRTTSTDASLIGVDAEGLYHIRQTSSGQPEFQVTPFDGSPVRPFWRDQPAHLWPTQVWSSGRGVWLVHGYETLDDAAQHNAWYWVDSQGVGSRANCEESPVLESGELIKFPVFGADGAYLTRSSSSPHWAQFIEFPFPQ